MKKRCRCGHAMVVDLRTVIFSKKVEIENVPVYSCPSCTRSEVCPEVKPDLTHLISGLSDVTSRKNILFQDVNEFAYLIHQIHFRRCSSHSAAIDQIIEERINDLLDLLLVAQHLGDEHWIDQLSVRLNQITLYRHIPQEMMKK